MTKKEREEIYEKNVWMDKYAETLNEMLYYDPEGKEAIYDIGLKEAKTEIAKKMIFNSSICNFKKMLIY